MSLLCHCVIVCDSTLFSATFAHRAQRTHGTNASPCGLWERTHTDEALSCWCGWSSSRIGRATTRYAATCVGTHGRAIQNRLSSTFKRVLVGKLCLPGAATCGPCPKTCCWWRCQAHPPTTDEGTEKQEKIYCRCRYSSRRINSSII